MDDTKLEKLAPWMRWTYTIGTIVTAVGVTLMSPSVLWTLSAITAVGVALPFHPFDLLYNYAVRHLTRTGPFPSSGPQRHFVFAVATVWLALTGWCFYIGADISGVVLGAMLIVVGGVASASHFCVPSFIYNTIAGRHSEPAVRGGT